MSVVNLRVTNKVMTEIKTRFQKKLLHKRERMRQGIDVPSRI